MQMLIPRLHPQQVLTIKMTVIFSISSSLLVMNMEMRIVYKNQCVTSTYK